MKAPEWFAETYSVRSESHFSLLLFWIHAEVMRRSSSMSFRQTLLRSRRLQYKRDRLTIQHIYMKEKMTDTQMLALILPEDDRGDGTIHQMSGARGSVKMFNTKRIFTASRGIDKIKPSKRTVGGYRVSVNLPNNGGIQELGFYETNIQAALVHDQEIRKLYSSEESEKMVNMNVENTQRVVLNHLTTPSLMEVWPTDEVNAHNDLQMLNQLSILDPVTHHVKPLHPGL